MHSDSNSTPAHSDDDLPAVSDGDEDSAAGGIPQITHSVLFKCIGAVRDQKF